MACASDGDIFCRECAVSNLLAQRKEIKRLEKEDERRRREEDENERERGEEEKGTAVKDFERVMMGLEGGAKKKINGGSVAKDEKAVKEGRGVKRKFELDEDELLRNAKEERAKARKALDEEKVLHLLSVKYRYRTLLLNKIPQSGLRTNAALLLGPFLDTFLHNHAHLIIHETP